VPEQFPYLFAQLLGLIKELETPIESQVGAYDAATYIARRLVPTILEDLRDGCDLQVAEGIPDPVNGGIRASENGAVTDRCED